jgi:hypothetical protein
MPSSLTGLICSLAWTDFGHPRPGNAPSKGRSAPAAYTHAECKSTPKTFQPVAGSRPARFALVDNLNVSVSFNRNESWVMRWVFGLPQQVQNDLLHHEQGHYDMTALVCRDYFVDVMLLKLQTFATKSAGEAAVQHIKQQSLDKLKKIHYLYDLEVHREQELGQSRGPIQQSWDRSIQKAFTQARSTGTMAPGGVPHKMRLVDVLTQNGKQI